MKIPGNLIIFLDEMLYELYENRLEVCLIPSEDQACADDGGMIRVPISQNVEWYQELCKLHPRTYVRHTQIRKIRTKLKRRNIIMVLEGMIKNKKSRSEHAPFLLGVAQSRKETIEKLEAAEYKTWDGQF